MEQRLEKNIKSVSISLVRETFPAEYEIMIHYTDGTQQQSSTDARTLAKEYLNYLSTSDKKRVLAEVQHLDKAFPKEIDIESVSIDTILESFPARYKITIHYTDGTQQQSSTDARTLAKQYINYLSASAKQGVLEEVRLLDSRSSPQETKNEPDFVLVPPYTYEKAFQELQSYVGSSKKARIAKGAWNHHHISLVSDFLKTYEPMVSNAENEPKIIHFLGMFKTALRNSSQKINPKGALSHCITSIQQQAYVNIIDIEEINKNIEHYQDALNELATYSRYQHGHSILAATARFFTLAWNRKNISEVDSVLRKHKDSLYTGPKTTEQLLKDLNTDLRFRINKLEMVTKPDYINPKGHLAKAIAKIQGQNQLNIINIEAINSEIDSKLQKMFPYNPGSVL